MNKLTLFIFVALLCNLLPAQENKTAASLSNLIEKWDFYEISLPGPATGNPFVDIEFSAVFKNGDRTCEPEGFYDGHGVYKIRFMPDSEGIWTYETKITVWYWTAKWANLP